MFERQVAFTYLVLVAFGLFGWTMSRLTLVLLQGRTPGRGFGQWVARLGDVLLYFFAQRTVARESLSWHHLPIFWGFLVITVGTIEIIVNGLVPGVSFALLGDAFNGAFKGVLDITNALVLFAVGYAVYRRIFKTPKLIPMSGDAALILGMIAMLTISHFFTHGMQVVAAEGLSPRFQPAALGPHGVHGAMPVSSLVAAAFSGIPPKTAHAIFRSQLLDPRSDYSLFSKLHSLLEAPAPARRTPQHLAAPPRPIGDHAQTGFGGRVAMGRRSLRAIRLEIAARYLRLHGMRALQQRLSRNGHRQAAQPDASGPRYSNRNAGARRTTSQTLTCGKKDCRQYGRT